MQTLSSGRGSGLLVAPLRGVRYNPHRATGIANVTSPPYDVIGAAKLDELLSADPHNVVRLILPGLLPAAQAGGAGPNEQAARRLRSWLAAEVLTPDPAPALYVYEQRPTEPAGPASWVQRGLIALVKVGSPTESGVVPHENVMPGPVRDRRDLMAATRANLEPIFLVYEGGAGAATTLTDEVAGGEEPLATAQTDGITHRLWRVDDPARQGAAAADLASRTALIADGHHRYAAYREVRGLMRQAGHGAGPWDYGLALLVDADAYPPALGAIHRVIPGLAPGRAAELAARAFEVSGVPADGLEQALDRLADAGRAGPAFLLGGDGYALLSRPDAALARSAMPARASAAWQRLDAAVLQRLLLATAWGVEDNDREVLVFHDAAEAVSAAAKTGGTAVLTNPVPFADVRDLALAGERMPRKSTSFGPKPRSGLVLRTFDD